MPTPVDDLARQILDALLKAAGPLGGQPPAPQGQPLPASPPQPQSPLGGAPPRTMPNWTAPAAPPRSMPNPATAHMPRSMPNWAAPQSVPNIPLQLQGTNAPPPAIPRPPSVGLGVPANQRPSQALAQLGGAPPQQGQQAGRSAQALKAFSQALSGPTAMLEKLAESGGKLGAAATGAVAALRTVGAMRGAYGWTMGVMARGSPNMAGQMQGTMDLVSNRLAGLLSTPAYHANAAIQGATDMRPGTTIGGAAGFTIGGTLGGLIGLPFGMPLTGAAIGSAIGTPIGAAAGAYVAGERPRPSMAGLPQATVGGADDWYTSTMLKSLSLGTGTLESENERRRMELLEKQIGLLSGILNEIRGSATPLN